MPKSPAAPALTPNPSAPASIERPKRVVKSALLCDDDGGSLVEGTHIDRDELARLAQWMCEWNIFHHHDKESSNRPKPCERCREDSARLLGACPFIEMNRAPELELV
ncbi:MAG: hypothetical protein ACLGSD_13825 [Acidobacteriota bacterium]